MIKWKYDIRMGILGIIQSKKDGTKCVLSLPSTNSILIILLKKVFSKIPNMSK